MLRTILLKGDAETVPSLSPPRKSQKIHQPLQIAIGIPGHIQGSQRCQCDTTADETQLADVVERPLVPEIQIQFLQPATGLFQMPGNLIDDDVWFSNVARIPPQREGGWTRHIIVALQCVENGVDACMDVRLRIRIVCPTHVCGWGQYQQMIFVGDGRHDVEYATKARWCDPRDGVVFTLQCNPPHRANTPHGCYASPPSEPGDGAQNVGCEHGTLLSFGDQMVLGNIVGMTSR